jgi:deoxyadenosine/deoxycytidine kinase
VSEIQTKKLIAIEGPIGVGKTTLARKLAEYYQAELLLEEAEYNPFLPRFYQDPRSGALPTQLHFLFQRARQLKELR